MFLIKRNLYVSLVWKHQKHNRILDIFKTFPDVSWSRNILIFPVTTKIIMILMAKCVDVIRIVFFDNKESITGYYNTYHCYCYCFHNFYYQFQLPLLLSSIISYYYGCYCYIINCYTNYYNWFSSISRKNHNQ